MEAAIRPMRLLSVASPPSPCLGGFGSRKNPSSPCSPAQISLFDSNRKVCAVTASSKRTEAARNGNGGATEERQSMPAVQKLYDACKKAFGGGNPTQEALEKVRLILDQMKPSDLGLEENVEDAGDIERGFGKLGGNGRRGRPTVVVPRVSPPITYLELYDCDEFSMGIFCLPTSASLPLHNHPGMTVLSKVLYGSMHVKAYDWVNPTDEKRNGRIKEPCLAKLVEDEVLTAPCGTELLHPYKSNLHSFTAVTPCAVLDVLAPPYDASKGRHCTYFNEVFPTHFLEGDRETNRGRGSGAGGGEREATTVWLQEFRPPDDFVVQRGVYRGPKVKPL